MSLALLTNMLDVSMLISTGPHILQPYWLVAHTMAIWCNVVRVGHVRVRWHCGSCEVACEVEGVWHVRVRVCGM